MKLMYVIEQHDNMLWYAWNAEKTDLDEYSAYGAHGQGKTPEEALKNLINYREELHGS